MSVVDKSFTCYYFTNLLEVHLGPCSCACFNPWSMSFWMVYIFILSLKVLLLLGLVGKAAYPPILFTPALFSGFHLPIGFFYLHKVSFQHFGLKKKSLGLHSVLKGSSFWSYLSNIFLKEALTLSAK